MTNVLPPVNSRSEFVTFLREFRLDFEKHPEQWENLTLDRFLAAMEAWVDDADMNASPEAWKLVQSCLLAARIYE